MSPRIRKLFPFESRLLQLNEEWPAQITEGWEAKPVGCAFFRPLEAGHREILGEDLILYTIHDGVFVVVRYDSITDHAAAKIIGAEEADGLLRKASNDNDLMRGRPSEFATFLGVHYSTFNRWRGRKFWCEDVEGTHEVLCRRSELEKLRR